MLHQINAEPWNQLAPSWAHAMQAALIHGMAALTIVVVFWALFRRNMSHAISGCTHQSRHCCLVCRLACGDCIYSASACFASGTGSSA